MTSPRFLSLDSIPARALGAPTPTSCCDLSGSLNQRSEYFGTFFFHKERMSDRVVQTSWATFGIALEGQFLSSFTLGSASPTERGMVFPSKSSVDSCSAWEFFLFERSCSSTTGLDPAITVAMPLSCR